MAEGDLVGIFEVNANRDTASQSGDNDGQASFLDKPLEKKRGGFAFDRGVGSDDDFFDVVGLDALNELRDVQLLGTDTIDRRYSATEYVIGALELVCPLKCDDIKRFFNNGDELFVASRVAVEWRDVLALVNQRERDWARLDVRMQAL